MCVMIFSTEERRKCKYTWWPPNRHLNEAKLEQATLNIGAAISLSVVGGYVYIKKKKEKKSLKNSFLTILINIM